MSTWIKAPTQPGHYWMRYKTKFGVTKRPRVVSIIKHFGNKRLMYFMGVKPIYVSEVDSEYQGPIPEPKE